MRCIGLFFVVLAVMITGVAAAHAASQTPSKKIPSYVDLNLKDVTVEEGISALFTQSGYEYIINPGVSGRVVELRIKGVTFDQALKAFAKAAEFTYTVSGGVYTIRPVAKPQSCDTSISIVQEGGARQPKQPATGMMGRYSSPQSNNQAQAPLPTGGQSSVLPQQVVVNQQAPVFYGQPAGNFGYNPGYYGYPPYSYRAGNIGIIGGWSSIAVLGGNPNVVSVGPGYPPPPGWVSPDVLRFLRGVWAITPRVNIGYGYW